MHAAQRKYIVLTTETYDNLLIATKPMYESCNGIHGVNRSRSLSVERYKLNTGVKYTNRLLQVGSLQITSIFFTKWPQAVATILLILGLIYICCTHYYGEKKTYSTLTPDFHTLYVIICTH